MAVHAGERARETGTFHCRDCDAKVRVKKGDPIPECPCGGSAYNERTNEPSTRTATRKRKTVKKRPRPADRAASAKPKKAA